MAFGGGVTRLRLKRGVTFYKEIVGDWSWHALVLHRLLTPDTIVPLTFKLLHKSYRQPLLEHTGVSHVPVVADASYPHSLAPQYVDPRARREPDPLANCANRAAHRLHLL